MFIHVVYCIKHTNVMHIIASAVQGHFSEKFSARKLISQNMFLQAVLELSQAKEGGAHQDQEK